MSDLTMKQIAKANNVAIAHGLNPCDFMDALRVTLKIAEVLGMSQGGNTSTES